MRLKHEEQLSIKEKKKKTIQKDSQQQLAEHPFSTHVLPPHFTEQMSLKNSYCPSNSQGLLPLETSEQSRLRVKPSFELSHTHFPNATILPTCCRLTAMSLVTVIQNRSHRWLAWGNWQWQGLGTAYGCHAWAGSPPHCCNADLYNRSQCKEQGCQVASV